MYCVVRCFSGEWWSSLLLKGCSAQPGLKESSAESSAIPDCPILSLYDTVQKIVLSLLTARKGMRMLA